MIKHSNRCAEEAIGSLRILHHQEVPNPRHENHLNTVVLERGNVGRGVVRIDRDHRQLQSLQGPRHLAAVAERRVQRWPAVCGGNPSVKRNAQLLFVGQARPCANRKSVSRKICTETVVSVHINSGKLACLFGGSVLWRFGRVFVQVLRLLQAIPKPVKVTPSCGCRQAAHYRLFGAALVGKRGCGECAGATTPGAQSRRLETCHMKSKQSYTAKRYHSRVCN